MQYAPLIKACLAILLILTTSVRFVDSFQTSRHGLSSFGRQSWCPMDCSTALFGRSRQGREGGGYGGTKAAAEKIRVDYSAQKNRGLFTRIKLSILRLQAFWRGVFAKALGHFRNLQIRWHASHGKYSVYVLECAQGKYYVGSTQRMMKERWKEHISSRGGSLWTKFYKPIRILQRECVHNIPAPYYLGIESKVTAKLMMLHGVNNVRGAQFCDPRNFTMSDLPLLVGAIGHNLEMDYNEVEKMLASRLPPVPTTKSGAPKENNVLQVQLQPEKLHSRSSKRRQRELPPAPVAAVIARESEEESSAHLIIDDFSSSPSTSKYCVRCGRTNHNVESCFATSTSKGKAILGPVPSRATSSFSFASSSRKTDVDNPKGCVCYRCGRMGHWMKNCAEEFDNVGQPIV